MKLNISYFSRSSMVLSVALAASLLIYSERFAQSNPPSYRPVVVLRQAKPTITNARFRTVEEADRFLHDAELILGVTVQGESRAYPINMLTGPNREIINDDLGGLPIAATW